MAKPTPMHATARRNSSGRIPTCSHLEPYAGVAQRFAYLLVAGRRQRRKGQPYAAPDEPHLLDGPLDRYRVGFEKQVTVQRQEPVVELARLGGIAGERGR